MLAGPSSVSTSLVNHPENRIGPHKVPRINRCATFEWIPLQLVRINRVDAAVSSWGAPVELGLVDIDPLVELSGCTCRRCPGLACARAARYAIPRRSRRRIERSVISHIVERSHATRRSAADDCHESGERVGWFGRGCIKIVDTGRFESTEIWAIGVASVYPANSICTIDEVQGMHPVDTDQQDTAKDRRFSRVDMKSV
jgi:hypothetical protein